MSFIVLPLQSRFAEGCSGIFSLFLQAIKDEYAVVGYE